MVKLSITENVPWTFVMSVNNISHSLTVSNLYLTSKNDTKLWECRQIQTKNKTFLETPTYTIHINKNYVDAYVLHSRLIHINK